MQENEKELDIEAILNEELQETDTQMQASADEIEESGEYARAIEEIDCQKAQDWATLSNQVVGNENID